MGVGSQEDHQVTLFREPINEILAELHVSTDDVRRWMACGWISFDIDDIETLDMPYRWEVEFVRNIALAGLNDAQLDEILRPLPKPYRFPPDAVAYHFLHGWVRPAHPDIAQIIEEELDGWLESLANNQDLGQLQLIHDRISDLIEEHEKNCDV